MSGARDDLLVRLAAMPAPPEALAPELARAREALGEALARAPQVTPPADDPVSRAALDRLLALSPFAAGVLARAPARLELLRQGPEALLDADRLPHADAALADEAARTVLRRHRNAVMLRLVGESLAGRDGLAGVLAATSRLAEHCLAFAVAQAHARLAARFGEPRDAAGRRLELVTLAMGKLGGGELNFSSDIDLVFLYPDTGATDGPRSLANEEFFARQVKRVVALLDERTADGFVFRVDTRLRPFGLSSAPVVSFAALEAYLQQHARDWERYAYVRARPVTGAATDRNQVRELLRPFVYRAYLDYSVLESVRDIRARIRAQARRRAARDDIKLGAGGIRELEFVVQTFQVLHGGRDRDLRRPGTLAALEVVVERGLLPALSGERLREAYQLLRHVENAVQMTRDEQTHALPASPPERARIACHLGFADWPALADALGRVRTWVNAEFSAAVVGGEEEAGDGDDELHELTVLAEGAEGELAAALHARGLAQAQAQEIAALVTGVRESAWYVRLTQSARARLRHLLPRLLGAAVELTVDAASLHRVLRVLEAVGSRSVYFAALAENGHALRHLLRVCQLGPVVADQLVRTPALIDVLLDPQLLLQPPTTRELREDLLRRLRALEADDEEACLDAMRLFQRQAVFQVAIADLLDLISVSAVSDLLTDVAELLLQQALATARRALEARHGRPRDAEGAEVPFAVLAYGKLGGRELGYGSDLDLVFLHGDAPRETDGPRALPGEVYFRRLAQRLIHVLSTQSGTGTLYQVDMRLRPSGNAGLLVTSLNAFATYQKSEAWTWEHQALLRARTVAGDAALRERVEAVRREILCRPRDRETLRRDVLAMRERMRQAEGNLATPGCFDLKRDPGGLVDLEFLVQFLVLLHAGAHPELVVVRDNASQLRMLGALGLLDGARAEALARAYHALRGLAHRASLRGETQATAPAGAAAEAAQRIAHAFAGILGASVTPG